MKIKIFDTETFKDSTVIVFKDYINNIYDVFVEADNISGLVYQNDELLAKLKFRKNVMSA